MQFASVVHGTEFGQRNVPTAPAKRGSGAVTSPARILVTVSSTAVTELHLQQAIQQAGQQSPDWLPQSGDATPAGMPPACGSLRLW